MIIEDFVSFETAKLLKEKGFDVCCMAVYSLQGQFNNPASIFSLKNNEFIYAPTLQMAMKWLREVHNIVIAIDYDYEFTADSYCFKIYRLGENGKPERCVVKGEHYDKETDKMVEDIVGHRDYERSYDEYITYEQAAEAAIKYCLLKFV